MSTSLVDLEHLLSEFTVSVVLLEVELKRHESLGGDQDYIASIKDKLSVCYQASVAGELVLEDPRDDHKELWRLVARLNEWVENETIQIISGYGE